MSDATVSVIRSPAYPSMSLEQAVDAVAKIESKYRSSPVDRADGAKLVGFKTLSGPANKALAALASYGLVERAGKGEMRVTSRAKAILHPQNMEEKGAALAAAAMEPRLFRDLRARFEGVATPPEDGVLTYLNRQGFNQSALRPAAKAFLQTLSYLEASGAIESHGVALESEANSRSPDTDDRVFGGAKVGDLIQWESQGLLQFERPLRVRLVSEDRAWIAVDGSETGIPMNEVLVEERGVADRPPPPRFAMGSAKDEEAGTSSGEVEWMRNRLARDTNVRLLVKGDMGPREIGKLIRILEAQKAVLEDEDESE